MRHDQTEQLPVWLTLQAATKLVSRSESTLRRRAQAGKFRWKKDGKSRLIETKSLLEYYEQLPS